MQISLTEQLGLCYTRTLINTVCVYFKQHNTRVTPKSDWVEFCVDNKGQASIYLNKYIIWEK